MGSYSSNYLRLLSDTKILTSLVNKGHHHQALSLFCKIHSSLSQSSDPFIFPLALKSCSALKHRQMGTSIHGLAVKSSFIANPFVSCGLVDLYGKCFSILEARKLFDEITLRNVVVWNSMISLYTRSKDMQSALQLFETMDFPPNASTFNTIITGFVSREDGFSDVIFFYRKMQKMSIEPNLITILGLLRASVGISSLHLIQETHCYSIRRDNIDPHGHLRSGLIEAYGRLGCLEKARHLFDEMPQRDVVAWSSLISAYALHGQARTALDIFAQMEAENIKPDELAFLAVLKACSHGGLADEARIYFSRMESVYAMKPNSDHYACLTDVLSRAGKLYEAYEILKGRPDKCSAGAWGALLGACRTYGELDLAEIAGKALMEIEPENPANFVILSRIYASKGRHEEVASLRKEMDVRGVRSTPGSSWIARHR